MKQLNPLFTQPVVEVENNSPFSFDFEGCEVRVMVDDNGDPWFVLKDILKAMGSSTPVTTAKSSIIKGLGKGFDVDKPLQTSGGVQKLTIIAESATTFLVSRSNTEMGRKLNRFIHTEVLPQIRKTGSYNGTNQQVPQFDMTRIVSDMSPEAIALVTTINDALTATLGKVKQLTHEAEENAPKVKVFEQLVESKGLMSMNECSKNIGVKNLGQKRLFAILRFEEVLQSGVQGSKNLPFQRFLNSGYFTVKTSVIPNGTTKRTTKVTPKGAAWIFKMLLERGWVIEADEDLVFNEEYFKEVNLQ